MDRFAILDSRKRALIALVHTLLFLTIAALQLALSRARPWSLHDGRLGAAVLPAIYVIVTVVLLLLLRSAGCATERVYFSLCAGSGLLGLFRMLVGDPVLHASLLRVILLVGAAVTGLLILRIHSSTENSPSGAGQTRD